MGEASSGTSASASMNVQNSLRTSAMHCNRTRTCNRRPYYFACPIISSDSSLAS